MNAAIYLRVSTLDQDYERQRDELLELATREGYNVPEEYIFEEKKSAVKQFAGYRDELEKLRKLTKKDIDKVYIWDITRLSRRAIDFINLVNEFTEKGICLHFKDRNIQTLDKDGKQDMFTSLYLYILGQFAQMDAENLKEKFKSGKLRSYREGNSHTSRPLYGYTIINKKLVVVEEEAKVVRLMFDLANNGYTLQKISDVLASKGYKAKKGEYWSTSTIYNHLKNTAYKGKPRVYEHNELRSNGRKRILRTDSYTEYNCPAIVSEAVFDKVQSCLNARQKITKRNNWQSLTRGKIICAVCGNHFVFATRPKGLGYQCSDKRKERSTKIGCSNGGLSVKLIDEVVWDIVKQVYVKRSYAEAVIKEQENREKEIRENIDLIQEYKRQLVQLDKEKSRITQGYIKGIIEEDEAYRQQSNNKSKIDSLCKQIKQLESLNIVLQKQPKEVKINDNLTFEGKQKVIDELIDYIKLYSVKGTKYIVAGIFFKVGIDYTAFINVQNKKVSVFSSEELVINWEFVDMNSPLYNINIDKPLISYDLENIHILQFIKDYL